MSDCQIDFYKNLKSVNEKTLSIFLASSFTRQISPQFLADSVLAYPKRTGKGLRPALTMWVCGLFGKDTERAEKIAAAVEMFHIWTLVHDDIIDDDDVRRGGPSVHKHIEDLLLTKNAAIERSQARRYGSDFAILCGDIQHAWANTLILDSATNGLDPEIVLSVSRRLNSTITPGVITGQAIDIELSLLPISSISPEQIESMLLLKTGLLIRFAAECGALIGLGITDFDDPRVAEIGEFAEKAALAFQLKDDLLGTLGDQDSLGKPIGSDLREGKRTLLYATATNLLGDHDREHFLTCLGNPKSSNDDYQTVCNYLRECGAIGKIEDRIRELVSAAEGLLDKAPDNNYKQLLKQWIQFIHTRDH